MEGTKMESKNEISMQELWNIFKKKWVWIAIVALFCGCVGALAGQFLVKDRYTCLMTCQVKYPSNATYTEIQAAKEITKQYVVRLQSKTAIEKVVQKQPWRKADIESWIPQVVSGTKVSMPKEETSNFSIRVTTGSPQVSYAIIGTYRDMMPELVEENYNSYAVEIIDIPSTMPGAADNADRALKYGLIAFLVGALVAYFIFVAKALTDVTIRNEHDIKQVTDLPILGAIPNVNSKNSLEYGKK